MDLTHAQWRKSTRSAGNEGECVEVSTNLRDVIAIRDSKNPTGPALILTPAQWADLLDDIKKGRFTF
jgi:Domain of unknown function (DUF397).